MPCAAICATCSALSRRPRMPPWICGTSVFTRPSSISGKPECSDTSFTATPASRSARAEPPVDRISTPLRRQRLRERHQTGLVGDGDQRAANGDDVGHGVRVDTGLRATTQAGPASAPRPCLRRTAPSPARGPPDPSPRAVRHPSASRASAAASGATCRGGTSNPVTSGTTCSADRATSLATTGRPASIASITDIGSASN